MPTQTIYSTDKEKILFEGEFDSFTETLEQAILDKINLSTADLRNKNLTNACLDDAELNYADFSGSNLTGTNLSEASLYHARFVGTDLYNTCLAYADLTYCDFTDASFGATDIYDSDISNANFSTLSCFSLDFASAQRMENCVYRNPDGQILLMSRPPVVIRGMGRKTIVFTGDFWLHGHDMIPWPEHSRFSIFPKNADISKS